MKKHFKLFLLILTINFVFLFGCTSNKELSEEEINKRVEEAFAKIDSTALEIDRANPTGAAINDLTILTVNDFHGALEEDSGEKGIARTGQYIVDKYNSAPDSTIVISAGDMFQGSAISNYRHGRDVINAMNAIGFELMVIGNHEFDWTLDEVLKYRDGDLTNGEANFPFLACNIADLKNDYKLPNYVEPYTILNKGNLKVGVIGYIGYGLEDDIATSMVKDYKFLEPVPIIEKYAIELRKEQKCDVVIVAGHDDSDVTNYSIANLSGDAQVDAIVNAHTHLEKAGVINGSDGRRVPYVEAGTAGQYIGEISLSISDNKANYEGVRNIRMDRYVNKNKQLDDYVLKVIDATAPIFERVLVTAGTDINRYRCTDWAVNSLRDYFDVDVAFINYGGIRASAFPIKNGDKVKVSKVYQIMPFDNTIKLVKLTGRQILNITNSTEVTYSDSLVLKNVQTINGKNLVPTELYTVAAVDYIFDKPEYPFLSGEDIESTGVLFRDVLIDALEKIESSNKKWK